MAKVPRDRAFAMAVLFTGHGPNTFKGKRHDLHGAYLPELMLENAEMPGVILDGSDLRKAWLKGTNLRGSRLVQADLHEANLDGADLRDCLLVNTNLMNATLSGADLRGADLTRAKLQGATLQNAKLDGAEQLRLVASLYDTVLPADIESELKQGHSRLFRKPTNPEDDPDYFS